MSRQIGVGGVGGVGGGGFFWPGEGEDAGWGLGSGLVRAGCAFPLGVGFPGWDRPVWQVVGLGSLSGEWPTGRRP